MQLMLTRAPTAKPFTYDLNAVAFELANHARFLDVPNSPFYSIAQHAVSVSLYQELIGAAISVQAWGLHHEDQYAYDFNNPEGLDYCQRRIAEAMPLKPAWPPPASLHLHNLVVTLTEYRFLRLEDNGIALDPAIFDAAMPDERLHYALKPLPVERARVLYLQRHAELWKYH